MSNKKLNPFKKEEFILLLWSPGPPQSKGLCLAIHSLVKYCVPLGIYICRHLGTHGLELNVFSARPTIPVVPATPSYTLC